MADTGGSDSNMKSFDGSSLGPIFGGHRVCGWMSIILYDLDQFLEVIPIRGWEGWMAGWAGVMPPTFTSQRPNRQYELLDEDVFVFLVLYLYSHFLGIHIWQPCSFWEQCWSPYSPHFKKKILMHIVLVVEYYDSVSFIAQYSLLTNLFKIRYFSNFSRCSWPNFKK